jgi:hypothetical protein
VLTADAPPAAACGVGAGVAAAGRSGHGINDTRRQAAQAATRSRSARPALPDAPALALHGAAALPLTPTRALLLARPGRQAGAMRAAAAPPRAANL